MIAVLLSFIYITLFTTVIGVGVLGLVKDTKFTTEKLDFQPIHYMMVGIIAITVYVEFFSLFARIGAVAHIILLMIAVIIGYFRRNRLNSLYKEYRSIIFSWEGFFYVCFIILIAFFTSRGEFHTDTNIYHAAAIRLYEEYGIIKGVGNLQLHYAYNSSYLAFASFFSLNWLFGRSLHTTTGWLEIIMCLYAFHGLKDFKHHNCHITDMMKVGILFYTLVNLIRSMSPATDYATMYFVFFIITAWCENYEWKRAGITMYSLLSVTAVFVATLKFSACLIVLIAIYPAFFLVKNKKWKDIASYLICGFAILLPFLIRNFFISGWLLYPFAGIDIFNVEWKIPKAHLLLDAAQIKTWGRCLYDVAKENIPVSDWLPIWWEHQERYEQMFLFAVVLGAIMQIIILLDGIFRRRRFRPELAVLFLAIWGNLVVWFFMAPFIRYGLAFLFAVIMIAAGDYLSEKRKGLYRIVTGSLFFCMFVSVSPYWDRYITDAGVFVKHNISQPYYILQKDYDIGNMESCEINGNTIYFSAGGEVNSYHTYPSTLYKGMLDEATLIGDSIKDGFKPK
ncbi:MAG: hypothetical protein J1E98_04490 [Lachnospiraceae bacterium]|nr:hypothetical protein [Lachnospiraceae bacterium]